MLAGVEGGVDRRRTQESDGPQFHRRLSAWRNREAGIRRRSRSYRTPKYAALIDYAVFRKTAAAGRTTKTAKFAKRLPARKSRIGARLFQAFFRGTPRAAESGARHSGQNRQIPITMSGSHKDGSVGESIEAGHRSS
jgi:hypothetical protein